MTQPNQPLYTDELADNLRKRDGAKYRPSNGTEGEMFMERWCYRCTKDDQQNVFCPIIAKTMAFDVDNPEYPSEWQYNPQGQPICTAFEESDHD